MTIYLFLVALVIVLITVYFYFDFKRKKVFDQYIDLGVSLKFSDNTSLHTKSRYGLVMFHINGIKKEARALSIDRIKLHTNKLQLRSYTHISTKLPLPSDGVVLSVGVKKSRRISDKEFDKCYITISGFLLEDKNKKRAFKRKLAIAYHPTSKILPFI